MLSPSFCFSHRLAADITDKIVAMGYPAQKMEALYRNPMPEVQRYDFVGCGFWIRNWFA
jgi:hypothetical protein